MPLSSMVRSVARARAVAMSGSFNDSASCSTASSALENISMPEDLIPALAASRAEE